MAWVPPTAECRVAVGVIISVGVTPDRHLPPPTDHRANHQHRKHCLIEASKCKITYYLLAGSPLLPH